MVAPPSDGGFNAFSSSTTTQAAPGAMVAPLGGGDKYAALADLDSVFGATSSGLPVNWDASFGGGGRESWAGGGGQATSNGVTASTPATGALLSCLVLCALVLGGITQGRDIVREKFLCYIYFFRINFFPNS